MVRFQGPPGLIGRSARPGAKPGARRRRRRNHHRRPQARRRIPPPSQRNIPERPGRELYPVIELVGHLHRPEGIDPGKYPIRVDLQSGRSRRHGRPQPAGDQDHLSRRSRPGDSVPHAQGPGIRPDAQPDRAAPDGSPRRWGGPIAIVRMGVRKPTVEEIQAGSGGDVGLDWAASIGSGPCPFLTPGGAKCGLPCGPVCTARPRPKQPIAASRRIPLRRRRPRHPRGRGASGSVGRHRPARHGRRLRHRRQGPHRAASLADQRRLHLRPAVRRGAREHRPQSERRHPACQHRQAPQQVLTVRTASPARRNWSRTRSPQLTRERSRAIGLQGTTATPTRNRTTAAPSAFRGDVMTDHQSPAADPRARPQPPETRPDQGKDPARRDQDGGRPDDSGPDRKRRARPSGSGRRTR